MYICCIDAFLQYNNIEQVRKIYDPESRAIFDIFDPAYSEVSSMLSRNLIKPFLDSDAFKRLSMIYNFGDEHSSPKRRESLFKSIRRSFALTQREQINMDNDKDSSNSQVELSEMAIGAKEAEKHFDNPTLEQHL